MERAGMPLTASDFQMIMEAGGFIGDKTPWLRRLFEDGSAVTVVSRPQGFGKTHFLTMLRAFLEMDYARPNESPETARRLFAGTKIRQDAVFCGANFARWPVVFLRLNAVQGDTFDDLMQSLASVVARQAKSQDFLLASPQLSDDRKANFADLLRLPELSCEQQEEELRHALGEWTEALAETCGRSVVVLVDDYDAPLRLAQQSGCLDAMAPLMRGFFGWALKDSRSVRKAVLMGRLAPEATDEFHQFGFRGLTDPWLAGAFGFTAAERDEMLAKAGLSARKDDATAQCGGWRFGSETVSRPVDLLRFCQGADAAESVAAEEVNAFFEAADEAQLADFMRLLAGETIEAPAVDSLTVRDLDDRSDKVLWSRLWLAGAVTTVASGDDGGWRFQCPNAAVVNSLRQMVRAWLTTSRVKAAQAAEEARAAGDEWTARRLLENDRRKRDCLASAAL